MSTEKYDFEIGDEGLQYDILDLSYNKTTQAFIKNAGIKPDMKVLDVGCGAGVMTAWLAKQVGPTGSVLAIDNSKEQLMVTQKRIKREGLTNVTTEVCSAYDIAALNKTFDLIYCRFLLHHLHSPRKAIKTYFDHLNIGGLYIGEEGIISHAFAYPPTFAWQGYMPDLKDPQKEVEGEQRDGDIGIKLFYECKQSGFDIIDCRLVQPILWKKEQKQFMIENLLAFKKADLESGTTEEEWQRKYTETERLINDDNQVIGFYGSCQVAGVKN